MELEYAKKISTVIKKFKKKDDNKKDKRDKTRTKIKAKNLDKYQKGQKEKDNIPNKFTLKDEDGNEKNYSFHRETGDH